MQLDVLDVNKSYGKESILHHIEFSVGSGEIVGLVGRADAEKVRWHDCCAAMRSRIVERSCFVEKILLDLEKKNGSSSGAVYR